MADKNVVLTPDGVVKLEERLENLKTVRRKEVAAKIKEALAFGDLSENAEYDEAKNEQAFIEGEILTIENTLRSAKVIDDEDISTDIINVGSTVKVLDMEYNEEIVYTIVGSTEADPGKNKISNESPIGKTLLGKTTNEVVEVSVPDGTIKFKILEIKK